MKSYYVYILSNKNLKPLYIGVTNDLSRRVQEHKEKLIKGFTTKYNIDTLLWYEEFNSLEEAIAREKQLKNWHRDWKLNLIKAVNQEFRDLSEEL